MLPIVYGPPLLYTPLDILSRSLVGVMSCWYKESKRICWITFRKCWTGTVYCTAGPNGLSAAINCMCTQQIARLFARYSRRTQRNSATSIHLPVRLNCACTCTEWLVSCILVIARCESVRACIIRVGVNMWIYIYIHMRAYCMHTYIRMQDGKY